MKNKSQKQYIPLSEAAPLTPYSAAYLKLRILQGKLKGKKIGRNWYTTEGAINEYLQLYQKDASFAGAPVLVGQEKPLSAPKITEANLRTVPLDDLLALISYPREELIEALETGLLNGVKVGAEWYTRRDWLSLYIASSSIKPITSFESPVLSYKKEEQPVYTVPVIASEAAAERGNPDNAPELVFVNDKIQRDVRIASSPLPVVEPPRNDKKPSFQFPKISLPSFSLPKVNFSFLSNKSFQRATAGSLMALLLVFTLSQDSVRASFYDWSQEAIVAVSQTTKQLSSAIARTAANLASNAKVQITNAKVNLNDKYLTLALGIKSFDLDLSFDSLAF
ncbi:MAG: hypothetical protein AAB779_04370, partial [Patescibacteria group bacterium]